MGGGASAVRAPGALQRLSSVNSSPGGGRRRCRRGAAFREPPPTAPQSFARTPRHQHPRQRRPLPRPRRHPGRRPLEMHDPPGRRRRQTQPLSDAQPPTQRLPAGSRRPPPSAAPRARRRYRWRAPRRAAPPRAPPRALPEASSKKHATHGAALGARIDDRPRPPVERSGSRSRGPRTIASFGSCRPPAATCRRSPPTSYRHKRPRTQPSRDGCPALPRRRPPNSR